MGEEKMEPNFYHLFFPHLFCTADKHILLCVIQKKLLKRWQKLRCERWEKLILFMMGEIIKMRGIDFCFWHCQLAPECVKERARESERKDERGRGQVSE